jgi:hypothetical protein
MGWFSRKQEEYRLLDKKIPGGFAVWVSDPAKAKTSAFVNRLIGELAGSNKLPLGFATLLAASEVGAAIKTNVLEYPGGGYELHVYIPVRPSEPIKEQVFDNAEAASKRACDLAISSLPAMTNDQIQAQHLSLPSWMNLVLLEPGPRPPVEAAVAEALQATSNLIRAELNGSRCLGWIVGSAEAKGAISIVTRFKKADGDNANLWMFLWCGDGLLYIGLNKDVGGFMFAASGPK